MKLIKNIITCSSLLFSSIATFAAATPSGPWEISAAAGANWLHASDANTVFSYVVPIETDNNFVQRTTDSAIWKLGFGYHLFQNQLQHRDFLNDLLLGLNYYHTKASIYGVTEAFGAPVFNFHAPMQSQRLMLDIKPQLFTYQRISPYAILGLGYAWNKINLDEFAFPNALGIEQSDAYSLNSATSSHLAYEAGLGLRLAFTQHLSGTLEYLYAGLGNATPGASTDLDNPIARSPDFNLHTQSLLLGINWSF